jgi:hypothetical protein
MMDNCVIKYYEQGTTIRLIETHTESQYIDVFELNGSPADLSGATALFHLMEFSTGDNIWTKECPIILDPRAEVPGIDYPFTVIVNITSADTFGLTGHYTGQLELIDHNGASKRPFQVEIISDRRAG